MYNRRQIEHFRRQAQEKLDNLLDDPRPELLFRAAGDTRAHIRSTLDHLRLIRDARNLGFSLADTRVLLILSNNPDIASTQTQNLVQEKLIEVRKKMRALEYIEHKLAHAVQSCGLPENK